MTFDYSLYGVQFQCYHRSYLMDLSSSFFLDNKWFFSTLNFLCQNDQKLIQNTGINVGFKGLIGKYTAIMGNFLQIGPLVTQHPNKGFSNQRSYIEFHVYFNYFAIFDINYFL